MARPTTNATFEVLILQAGGTTSPAVLQSLRDKKFSPRLVSDLAALDALLGKMVDPILVIEAGHDSKKTKTLITQLENNAKAKALPIVLIGSDVEQFEKTLDKKFPAATTLNLPYGAVEMLAAINYLSRTVVQRRSIAASKPKEAAIEQQGPAVPEMVFAQLQKLGLVGKSIGGEPLSGADITKELLRSLNMLPVRPAVTDAVNGLLEKAGPWGKPHLLRVSYITQRMVMPLNPDVSLLESLRAASFLFAWSFAEERPDLLQRPLPMGGLETKELAGQSGGSIRTELASKIKDSALTVMQDLSLDKESKIISVMARLVAGEVKPGDDDVSIVACALMAADASDRLCYANGSWNPRRAYALLNRLKHGQATDYHPTVVCCLVKILAEAIAARTPVYLLPKELRRNKTLRKELMNQARQPVAKNERRVPLASLAPGMTLSRALIGLDGQEVLASDIQLDQDLIWRIWQLSAVKPLRSAIVFRPSGAGE